MPECTVYTYDTQKKTFCKPFTKEKQGPNNSVVCAERQAISELGSKTGRFLFVLSDFPCSLCHEAFLKFKTEARTVIVSVLGEKTTVVNYESEHLALVINHGSAASSSTSTSTAVTPIAAPSSSSADVRFNAGPSEAPPAMFLKKKKLSKTSKSALRPIAATATALPSSTASSNTNIGSQPAWGSNANKTKTFFGAKTYVNGPKERYQTLIYYQTNPAYWIINGPHTNIDSILTAAEFAILCGLDIKELTAAANLGLKPLPKERKKKNN